MREIKFYTTQSGKSPVAEFLDSLNSKQVQKITWVLNLVEQKHRIPREYFKKLSGSTGIWEVRAQSGSDIFRLLGFIDDGTFVVLTNGFVKKSQKTPKKELQIAENRKIDYLNRKGESI